MSELIVPIKQGEELSLPFVVKEDGNNLDLSSYNVRFQVKKAPLVDSPPLINKLITQTSDIDNEGQINYPQEGGWFVHLTKRDTSLPVGDYALVISLEAENFIDIISSKCCNKAIYRICEQ